MTMPNMTGGAAGPATSGSSQNVGGFGNVTFTRGGDNWQTLAIVVVAGVVVWQLTRKR